MNLLFVNDDGIDSASLHMVAQAAKDRGHHVLICAPARQQSAKSHCYTIASPIMVKPQKLPCADEAWAIEGTPADCTRLGLMSITDRPIDLVISGINDGYNTGLATYVSGTVGAAREATFHGVKALALSAEYRTPAETLRWFARWSIDLAERLAAYDMPPMSVCNVNVPPVTVEELRPPVICPLSRTLFSDGYERRESPRGGSYFWLTPTVEAKQTYTPGSDMDWVLKGHITVSFISVDGRDQPEASDLLPEI